MLEICLRSIKYVVPSLHSQFIYKNSLELELVTKTNKAIRHFLFTNFLGQLNDGAVIVHNKIVSIEGVMCRFNLDFYSLLKKDLIRQISRGIYFYRKIHHFDHSKYNFSYISVGAKINNVNTFFKI